MEYMIDFDSINEGGWTSYFEIDEWEDLIAYISSELDYCGGGHADIFNAETGEFIDDFEI